MDKLATLKVKNNISFKALESGETEVSFVVDKLTYSEKNHVRAALEGQERHLRWYLASSGKSAVLTPIIIFGR